jgi:hypothetical protein
MNLRPEGVKAFRGVDALSWAGTAPDQTSAKVSHCPARPDLSRAPTAGF